MRSIFIVLSLLVLNPVFGQIKLGFNIGYGTYQMSDLKDFQEELLLQLPTEAKITESFPGYLYFEGIGTKEFGENTFTGLSLAYASSGGRIHYADYSGEISADQLVTSFSVGIPLGLIFKANESIDIAIDLRPQAVITNLKLDFASRLFNQSESESLKFQSLNLALQPSVMVTKKFGNFGIEFQAGYHLTVLEGKLLYEEDDAYHLQNENGDEIHTSWSGLRMGLGISYRVGSN